MKLFGREWSIGWLLAACTIVAAIAGVLAIPGMPKFFHWDDKPATVSAKPTPQAEASTTFSGQVTSPGGAPIADASVIAFKDQAVGESIRTDSNGQFQIQVPAATQALRLTVTAVGYANTTIQANAHRTGPEEIVLQKALPPSPKTRSGKAASPSVSQAGQAPTTSPVVPPNQGIINNAPNQGIQNTCAPGVVNCDQSIHLEPSPPLPVANFRLSALSKERLQSELPYRYGNSPHVPPAAMLVIGVDRMFQAPTFQINCSAPCDLTHPQISEVRGPSIIIQNVSGIDARSTADSRHYLVSLGQPLAPRQGLMFIVTSFDDTAPAIESVLSAQTP